MGEDGADGPVGRPGEVGGVGVEDGGRGWECWCCRGDTVNGRELGRREVRGNYLRLRYRPCCPLSVVSILFSGEYVALGGGR
jgi:hypothetical protein